MPVLGGSVGLGGDNKDADLAKVRDLLNQHYPDQPLDQNSTIIDLIARIGAFQRDVAAFTHPDGKIDKAGRTLSALAADSNPAPAPSMLGGSVGAGGDNNPLDLAIVRLLLNKEYPDNPLPDNASVDDVTLKIRSFQKKVFGWADGRVDPNGGTLKDLVIGAPLPPDAPTPPDAPPPPIDSTTGLPAPNLNAARLTEDDFNWARDRIGCDIAAIKAVCDVESPRAGFLRSGRPTLLFESHTFSQRTHGDFDGSHPEVSQPHWVHDYGQGGDHQYDRMAIAMKLNLNAALESASWGRFQIMGWHWKDLGYASIQDFVAKMYSSERAQLEAFVTFVMNNAQLREAIIAKNWPLVARIYNGTGQVPQYAAELAADYNKERGLA
jgi:hypothetical protein